MQNPIEELTVLIPQIVSQDSLIRSKAIEQVYSDDARLFHPWIVATGKYEVQQMMNRWTAIQLRYGIHIHSISSMASADPALSTSNEQKIHMRVTQHSLPYFAAFARYPAMPTAVENWALGYLKQTHSKAGYSPQLNWSDIQLDMMLELILRKDQTTGLWKCAEQRDYYLEDPLFPLLIALLQFIIMWPIVKLFGVRDDFEMRRDHGVTWPAVVELLVKLGISRGIILTDLVANRVGWK